MLTVYAAASLGPALDQIKSAYPKGYGSLRVSTGSSAALRTQIEQGAPADLFLSADTTNPQALVDSGLTNGPAIPFATNRLTIVVPEGNPAGITSPADLGHDGVRVIAAIENVPIANYAEQCVNKLGLLAGYPQDFAASYEANVVSREENVGAVVSKIKLGEGDAAFVYLTDARSAGLPQVDIPADAQVVATYAGVVLTRAQSPIATRRLLDWIRGPDGLAILSELGFAPAP
jgi:molybdate transport system substrate-binding protein